VQTRVQVGVVGQGGAEHDVAVPREVLRDGVHDDIGAVLDRSLDERRRERVVDRDECAHVVRGSDQRGQVGDLEHGVRRGLDPQQRGRATAAHRCRHGVGVGDVDESHLDPGAGREVVCVRERDAVGVPWQDDAPAGRHERESRRDRCHARAEHERGERGPFERAERLLERVPCRGVGACVEQLACGWHARRDVRRGQHDGWVDRRAGRPCGPPSGDHEGRRVQVERRVGHGPSLPTPVRCRGRVGRDGHDTDDLDRQARHRCEASRAAAVRRTLG
jgi:hypothetical protein